MKNEKCKNEEMDEKMKKWRKEFFFKFCKRKTMKK